MEGGKVCEVYSVGGLTKRSCRIGIKYTSCGFSLKDDRRSGRPSDDEKINARFESNHHITVLEIALVENETKRLGVFKKIDYWVPQGLKKIYLL